MAALDWVRHPGAGAGLLLHQSARREPTFDGGLLGMAEALRVVHYLNQFFGGIGAEEKASLEPQQRAGAVGPGVVLARALGDHGQIVASLICGDNYANEQLNDLLVWAREQLEELKPDVLVAGPAFNAGRYGQACGALCAFVAENLGIPTLTGMYPENPGAEQFARMTYVVQTGNSATVAIVTEAGVVPNGNPDRLEFIRASKWHKYPIAGKDDLLAGEYEAIHGGYDNTWTNQDPDRILAVDVLRQREIAADLKANGVHAVVSPAT